MQKVKNYTLVTDFDLDAIRQAYAEGRLFITPRHKSSEDLRENGIHSILEYVSRIDDCTSSIYRSHIRIIWEQILRDPVLGNLFFYTRYARNRGEVNWYRVTAAVCLFHDWNVYRNDFTNTELHCLLEGTKKRNSRYTGMSRYLFDHDYFALIRKKLQNVQQ